jgi:hypothetical protein
MTRLRPDTPISDLTPEQLRAEAERKEADAPKPPYVGASLDKGIFRIVFAPVEAEFSCDDAAHDAARHSCWNNDSEFGDYKLEKVRSTVTQETHPYICACGECVSPTTEGRCEYCGEVNWKKREDG